MTGALLTLSIVSHGHGPMLARLLDDLARLRGLDGACVVVTLNAPGESLDTRPWPGLDIRLRHNAVPRGFGANHNAAFAECRTPWFAVLNPDLRLHADPFPALIARGAGLRAPGVVAPCIVDSGDRVEDTVRSNPTPWSIVHRTFDRDAGRADPTARFFWLAGMFLLFDARAFRRVGGFDERFFLYCEDYDICARLRRAGFGVALEPGVRAVHDAQRDSHRSPRHLRWHVASLLKVWTSGVFWWVVFGAGGEPARP